MGKYIIKSKTSLGKNKGFHYKFVFKNKSGKINTIELDAINNTMAKQLVELKQISNREILRKAGAPPTYTHYSIKAYISRDAQNNVLGNWSLNPAAACISTLLSTLQGNFFISMNDFRNCDSGQMLVVVEHY